MLFKSFVTFTVLANALAAPLAHQHHQHKEEKELFMLLPPPMLLLSLLVMVIKLPLLLLHL